MPERLTALSAEDLEDFFLLVPRIFGDYRDPRRGPFELAYIYANTPSNEDSMFLRAIDLANARQIRSLGTSDGDLGFGYEGFGHSLKRLYALGWKKTEEIPIVKFDVKGNVNTGSEARLLADYMRGKKGDLAVIAPPFHIVRAFMTTITALAGAPVRVYAIPGVLLPWMEEAVHSQGTLKKPRKDLLGSELQRLEKYRVPEFGSMLSAGKVIEYLNWRDG